MAHVLGAFVAGAYHYLLGLVHEALGYLCHLVGHGCREEEHLAVVGHVGEDVVDGIDKAHVQHLVGFVEYDGVHVVELYDASVYEVDQSAGRGHYYLHALSQGSYLALDA